MDRRFLRNKLGRSMRFSGFILGIALTLTGCASVSTRAVHHANAAEVSAPRRIYVQDFSVPEEVFRVDRPPQHLEVFRAAMAARLSAATVERIENRLDIPAVRLAPGEKPPREPAWLITGRFVRVNQGSRALRAVIGFGLGATKLETQVEVYDLRGRKPVRLLRFETTGGTNAQPGAAPGLIFPNYWLFAADAIVRLGPGLSLDLVRTSRQIVAVLSEYMAREGLLPEDRVYRAKQEGKWP